MHSDEERTKLTTNTWMGLTHADVPTQTLFDPYRNMYHVERILFLGPLHPVDTPKCT